MPSGVAEDGGSVAGAMMKKPIGHLLVVEADTKADAEAIAAVIPMHCRPVASTEIRAFTGRSQAEG